MQPTLLFHERSTDFCPSNSELLYTDGVIPAEEADSHRASATSDSQSQQQDLDLTGLSGGSDSSGGGGAAGAEASLDLSLMMDPSAGDISSTIPRHHQSHQHPAVAAAFSSSNQNHNMVSPDIVGTMGFDSANPFSSVSNGGHYHHHDQLQPRAQGQNLSQGHGNGHGQGDVKVESEQQLQDMMIDPSVHLS